MSRHQVHVDALRRSVLDGEGETARELRRAAAGQGGEVPAELAAYVDAVRDRAHAMGDEEVEALKAKGWSEDEIFEVTVATALGSALHRLDAALAAIDGVKR